MMLKCEVKIDGHWTLVGVDEARSKYKDSLKRCMFCFGAVHVYPREGSTASKPHFGHNEKNDGCPKKKHSKPIP